MVNLMSIKESKFYQGERGQKVHFRSFSDNTLVTTKKSNIG